MSRRLVLVAVVVALVAALCWLVFDGLLGSGGRQLGPPGGTLRVVDVRPDAAGAAAESAPSPERTSPDAAGAGAGPDAGVGLGSLEATVSWQVDGSPAQHQSIEVVAAGAPLAQLRPRRALTDPAGFCRIEGIPAGTITLFASTGYRESLVIEAGRCTTVEIVLQSTCLVRGLVVDADGSPVADADVWVSTAVRYGMPSRKESPGRGQHGAFALRSDAAGRFETRLHGVQSLSAVKAGYGPSRTVFPCLGAGSRSAVDVRLVLAREASELSVEVHDADGRPVAGAQVLVGHEMPRIVDQTDSSSTPPARRRTSDDLGRVEFVGLPVGKLPLQVRADGFAPWRERIELRADEANHAVVTLDRGVCIAGIVTDEFGRPQASALVFEGELESLASSSFCTDGSGRFELTSLPAGALELTAWHEHAGQCTLELHAEPGSRHDWHPVLTLRPSIGGIVLGPDGRPAVGAYVACSSGSDAAGAKTVETDEGGRFLVGPLQEGRTYVVTAEVVDARQGALRVSQRGVPPAAELTLRIQPGEDRTAGLTGRLLEADGSPARDTNLVVETIGESILQYVEVGADGRFTFGPVVPAKVRLVAVRSGVRFAELGVHELAAHAETHLGDVLLPPAGAAILRFEGAAVAGAVVDVSRAGQVVFSRPIDGNELRLDVLGPGEYDACVRGRAAGRVTGNSRFLVRSGATSEVALTLAAAYDVDVVVDCATPCRRMCTLTARSNGVVVLCMQVERPPNGRSLRIGLPAGTVDVRLETVDGCAGGGQVTVPTSTGLRLTLSR